MIIFFFHQKREKGRMRVHKLNNVTTALKLLEQNRVSIKIKETPHY